MRRWSPTNGTCCPARSWGGVFCAITTFLGLEPNEVVERRRTVADPTLAAVLAPTSAGSALPPVRNVDYRPREVDLREEEEGMETRELRLGPIFTVLGLLLAAIIIWFAREPLTSLAMATADGVQALFARTPAPIAQPAATDIAIINPQNLAAGTPGSGGRRLLLRHPRPRRRTTVTPARPGAVTNRRREPIPVWPS
ncbi:MAG: hypothetical protein R2851_11275 [Caldilineaceae bacterium]